MPRFHRWLRHALVKGCLLGLGLNLAGGWASTAEQAGPVIARLLAEYRRAWLANDSEGVLALFADDATIIPHGRAPLTGKEALRSFWFPPPDGSRTVIESFEIEPFESRADKDQAHGLGNGRLTWTYEKAGDHTRTQQEFSVVTIARRIGGEWKIAAQIWTDRNVQRVKLASAPGREAGSDETAVRKVAEDIIAADNVRDLERVMSLYDEGMVNLPPGGGLIEGKAEQRRRYEELFATSDLALVTNVHEVKIGGDWAWLRGTNSGEIRDRRTGVARPVADNYLMILRRVGSGWKIHRLMWIQGQSTTGK